MYQLTIDYLYNSANLRLYKKVITSTDTTEEYYLKLVCNSFVQKVGRQKLEDGSFKTAYDCPVLIFNLVISSLVHGLQEPRHFYFGLK